MVTSTLSPTRRSVLLSFKFLGTALAGSLTMALVCTFASLPAQLATLGACVSTLAGLFVSYVGQEDRREQRRAVLLEQLQVPIALAPEHELFDHYSAFCSGLTELARQSDPVLREFALLKLASISAQVRSLANGRILFSSTETWRTVYQRLLESPGLNQYRSVAWVKTRDYWQDQPGRQGMQLNFDFVARGGQVQRIHILRANLWPADQLLPSGDIGLWIDEQHNRGICVSLVRESDLDDEPDLLCDWGIYNDRATGVQELDEHARTVRFTLWFDHQNVRLASERWRRISLYAVPYLDLLDCRSRNDTG